MDVFHRRPSSVSDVLWDQAKRDNPDPSRLTPGTITPPLTYSTITPYIQYPSSLDRLLEF